MGRDKEAAAAGVLEDGVRVVRPPGTRFWNFSPLQYSSLSSKIALPWGLKRKMSKLVITPDILIS